MFLQNFVDAFTSRSGRTAWIVSNKCVIISVLKYWQKLLHIFWKHDDEGVRFYLVACIDC